MPRKCCINLPLELEGLLSANLQFGVGFALQTTAALLLCTNPVHAAAYLIRGPACAPTPSGVRVAPVLVDQLLRGGN